MNDIFTYVLTFFVSEKLFERTGNMVVQFGLAHKTEKPVSDIFCHNVIHMVIFGWKCLFLSELSIEWHVHLYSHNFYSISANIWNLTMWWFHLVLHTRLNNLCEGEIWVVIISPCLLLSIKYCFLCELLMEWHLDLCSHTLLLLEQKILAWWDGGSIWFGTQDRKHHAK